MRPIKCFTCKREIHRGGELTKAIAEYVQSDKTMKYYGWDRPDGKLNIVDPKAPKPTGRLSRMWHYKCFRLSEKREARGGDAITGRGMGNIPTAYEIGKLTANQDELKQMGLSEEEARKTNTAEFSQRVKEQRAAAQAAGTGAEDQAFKEKQRAEAAGGPYPHRHATGQIERHRIRAHLEFAHGVDSAEFTDKAHEELLQLHNETHAREVAEAKRKEREADPGYKEPGLGTSDWRHQEVRDVEELPVPALEKTDAGSSGESVSFEDL